MVRKADGLSGLDNDRTDGARAMAELVSRLSDATFEVEIPEHPGDVWELLVELGGVRVSVAWRPGVGYTVADRKVRRTTVDPEVAATNIVERSQ